MSRIASMQRIELSLNQKSLAFVLMRKPGFSGVRSLSKNSEHPIRSGI